MLDWLSNSSKDLPVWGQMVLDLLRAVIGFATVLIITRWTLARADRKDAITRQANALDAFSSLRIQSLHNAVAALSRMWIQLNKVYGALSSSMDDVDKAEAISKLLSKSEDHIDELTLALEEYGSPPGSIPTDYPDVAEALTAWLHGFYEHRNGVISHRSTAIMIGMCMDLQAQLRHLEHYELNMRLQVAHSPASAWNPDFGSVLEECQLEFLTKDGPAQTSRPVRVIGTIVEQDSEHDMARKKHASRRVLVLRSDRSGANLNP